MSLPLLWRNCRLLAQLVGWWWCISNDWFGPTKAVEVGVSQWNSKLKLGSFNIQIQGSSHPSFPSCHFTIHKHYHCNIIMIVSTHHPCKTLIWPTRMSSSALTWLMPSWCCQSSAVNLRLTCFDNFTQTLCLSVVVPTSFFLLRPLNKLSCNVTMLWSSHGNHNTQKEFTHASIQYHRDRWHIIRPPAVSTMFEACRSASSCALRAVMLSTVSCRVRTLSCNLLCSLRSIDISAEASANIDPSADFIPCNRSVNNCIYSYLQWFQWGSTLWKWCKSCKHDAIF